MLEEDFQYAIAHPKARQEFIDSIDLEEAKPYVDRVIYSHNSPVDRFALYQMRCHIPLGVLLLNKKGCKSNIVVPPRAFSLEFHRNSGDFLSALIDHEGYHARRFFLEASQAANTLWESANAFFTKEGKTKWRVKKAAIEQSCTYNQIVNFHRRNCSQEYIAMRKNMQVIYAKIIEQAQRNL